MSDPLSLVLLTLSAAVHAYLVNSHHSLKKSHDNHAIQLDVLHTASRVPLDQLQPIPRIPISHSNNISSIN